MNADIVVTDHEHAVAHAHGRRLVAHQCATAGEVADALIDADLAFVNLAPVTRDAISRMQPGGVLIRYGIGFDNVDIAAANDHGVRVCNVPDYGADTVADHAVACLLSLLRRTGPYTEAIRSRGWIAASDLGEIRGFRETTVGLVGLGRIGRAAATRLRAFGFRIIAADPFADRPWAQNAGVELVEIDELFTRSHAVSLHAPLHESNRNLVGARTLDLMPAGSVIVNTSRGGLVDEGALAAALSDGRLGGAALDVFDPEPLDIRSRLRQMDNVILTPHAAFYSVSSLDALQRLASEEADRALSGAALRCEVTRRTE